MDVQELAVRIFTVNVVRYVAFSGVAFLLFYVLLRRPWTSKKIQTPFPRHADYYREVGYSLITVVIFALIGILIFGTDLREHTLMYMSIDQYGWPYWVVSVIAMILLHDTYFYWMHRTIHHRWFYKTFHKVHHLSTNPSPWASYAFHPLEGILEAGVIFPIVFIIPFHPSALMVFLLFMMAYNVYGHLGFELYPKRFNLHPIGRWINTSVNHNLHHKYFTGNYGLYFLWWDRWMGTLREDYDSSFAEVDARRIGDKKDSARGTHPESRKTKKDPHF